jgi:hypothetical protein
MEYQGKSSKPRCSVEQRSRELRGPLDEAFWTHLNIESLSTKPRQLKEKARAVGMPRPRGLKTVWRSSNCH